MINLKYVTRKDFVITVLIFFNTFLYYSFNYISPESKTLDLYFFEIGSFGFPNIPQLMHYVKMKLLIIIFCLIWFFSCRNWWKFAILVVIAIELSKLITALDDTNYQLDEIDYIVSLPITIPIILILFLISKKLGKYNSSMILRTKLDKEIDIIFYELHGKRIDELSKLKEDLKKLKKTNYSNEGEAYLQQLLAIRNRFNEIETNE